MSRYRLFPLPPPLGGGVGGDGGLPRRGAAAAAGFWAKKSKRFFISRTWKPLSHGGDSLRKRKKKRISLSEEIPFVRC